MNIPTLIFAVSGITVLFICNTDFMRTLGDRFERSINKIVDKLNKF